MFPDDKEEELWVALNLTQRAMYKTMETTLKSKGFPPPRWYDVLWAIERAKECGLRAREIERSLIFEQSNLSRLLRQMINEGLIKETQFERDKRGKILRISKKGRELRHAMWQVYGPLIHTQMQKISATSNPDCLTQNLNQLRAQVDD